MASAAIHNQADFTCMCVTSVLYWKESDLLLCYSLLMGFLNSSRLSLKYCIGSLWVLVFVFLLSYGWAGFLVGFVVCLLLDLA